jgi:prolyl oligopeptidase
LPTAQEAARADGRVKVFTLAGFYNELLDFSAYVRRVVDDYSGTKVADPYRWFEDDKSEATAKWVEAQNTVTFDYLAKIPFREKIRTRLTEIYNYPRYSAPFRIGKYYFFMKNDGLQNQSVYYIQEGLEGEPRVFLDPNALSPDGTTRAFLSGFSNDDRYATYSRSEGGSDWTEMRVIEIETGKELEDRIQWTKFGGPPGRETVLFRFEKPPRAESRWPTKPEDLYKPDGANARHAAYETAHPRWAIT